MTKVLVIDSLTETFRGPIVRSGLQKSSKLDARAFHKMGYDTTYVYCGDLEDHYEYKKFRVNDIGAKEQLLNEGKHMRATSIYVKQYLHRAAHLICEADYIIVHCHSIGAMTGVNAIAEGKKIMFVVHDVIDMTWACGFSSAIVKMRSTNRNTTFIATNSRYSIDRLNFIHGRTRGKEYLKDKDLISGDEAFDGFIEHFVWTDVVPDALDVVTHYNSSAVIGRYEPAKFHHKLYGYSNPRNVIVHYGIKDPRRDEGLKYYESLKLKANSYMEDLNDEDLWKAIKHSQSIVLPCWHEGFGYTAFEAGIFGVVPVILTKPIETGNEGVHRHATVEYLQRAGVKHFTADFSDEVSIYKAIDDSLDVSAKDRLDISNKLLEYFTVEEYVGERLRLMDGGRVPRKRAASVESFF